MHLSRQAPAASFVIVLAAIILSLVTGSATPAWLVTMWIPPGEGLGESPLPPVLAGLLLLGLVNAWTFWQILRRPEAAPKGRAARWLRPLLYANAVWLLTPSFLPYLVECVIGLVLQVAALVLFVVVVSGPGRLFRLLLLLFGLVEPVDSLVSLLRDDPALVLLMSSTSKAIVMAVGLAAFVTMVMFLLAQRRDGRWTRATLLIGAGTFVSGLLVEVVDELTSGGPYESIAEAMDVLYIVWLARTAYELSREPRRHKTPLRVPSGVVAAATVTLLMAVGPENQPRLTYTWRSDVFQHCWTGSEPPRAADLKAHERDRAYLCSVHKPDRRVSDQALLGRGRDACARVAAGVQVNARPSLLALLCPEVIGRRYPDLVLSSDQISQRETAKETEAREKAKKEARELDAQCRDPWPALRTRSQATASYYDWDSRPYGISDPEADTEEDHGTIWDEEHLDALEVSGELALIFTPSQDWMTCVTAKALRSSPPPLRRKGWDAVLEADIITESGKLTMQTLSASEVRFPDLARNGPGRYRLRLYTREGVDLLLVYPAEKATAGRESDGRQ